MKEYYSIPLEDEEAQTILEIDQLIDESVKSVPFLGDIDTALEDVDFGATFWYKDSHVVGLSFLGSKISRLPESIGNLKSLLFLFIEESPIQYIPSSFKELYDLEKLMFINDPEINSTVILDFPDIFSYLNKLKTFYVDGNFLIFIPSSFIELENLEELILEQCFFVTNHSFFEQTIEEMKVKSKDIRPNNELPNDLGTLKSLKKIILKNVGLIELPTSIITLPALKELELNRVTIKNREIIFEIKSLEKLHLIYCRLTFIPKTIKNLANLKILNLAHNKLKEIPLEIGNCHQLEKINLTWNLFQKELVHLKSLHNLKQIVFDEAYPEIIPKELYNKKNLEIKGL